MNARELSPVAPASAVLPSSNQGNTSTLNLLAARSARDGLRSLLGAERSAASEFLLALADFDARRGWEPLGYASLFDFLRSEFRLSRSGAYWRQSAARLLERFPEVIAPLRDGRLCLTTAAEVAKVLTRANLADVLPRYYGLSSREAADVTAALQPRPEPPRRMVVTELALKVSTAPVSEVAAVSREAAAPSQAPVQALGLAPAHLPATRTEVEALSADLRRVHVTLSRETLAMLDAARAGMSQSLRDATPDQVLREALQALLEKQAKLRGQVDKPRKTVEVAPVATQAPADAPRHRRTGPRAAIPAAVKRAVWARDGARCCWPLDGGGTCGSTHRLELDHVVPWARGGEATVDNLRIVCHRHNAAAARAAFGAQVAGRYASSA